MNALSLSIEWMIIFLHGCALYSHLLVFSWLSWLSYSYKLVKLLSVCVFDVNRVAQIVLLHTETCNLVCTDLLMNPDRTPKTRPV